MSCHLVAESERRPKHRYSERILSMNKKGNNSIAHSLYCSVIDDCCLTIQDSATDYKSSIILFFNLFPSQRTWNSFSISGAQRVNSKFQNPYVSSLIRSINVVSKPHGCGRNATRRSNRMLHNELFKAKNAKVIEQTV